MSTARRPIPTLCRMRAWWRNYAVRFGNILYSKNDRIEIFFENVDTEIQSEKVMC